MVLSPIMRKSLFKNGINLFGALSVALVAATIVPLFATLLFWRFEYSGSSTEALGLQQIRTALDGSTELLSLYAPSGHPSADSVSLARLKRILNGPVTHIKIGTSSVAEAILALSAVLPDVKPVFSGDSILDEEGTDSGRKLPDGSWIISNVAWVDAIAGAWDALDEEGRRELANQSVHIRVVRDGSKAAIRVGSSGYIWAITAAKDSSERSWELFHPQIEAVEVSELVNAKGERIGAEIAGMRGRLHSGEWNKVMRYDYFWKNPEDDRDRKKIVLMRYIESWDVVLCSGLYEDEYYLPARAAESMFIVLVMLIAGITLVLSFLVAYKINAALETLARFSRLTSDADGTVHSLKRTGIREIDSLGASMSEMEDNILQRERALQKELDEKNVLVEEVHHRVKNNLAVLAGIINMQKLQSVGEEARMMLDILYSRVNSMAFVYQQLMGSSEYSCLPFDDFIRGVISYHQSSGVSVLRDIERIERLDPVVVDLETAVPLGLIVNEAISNMYRHGLPSDGKAVIVIDLHSSDDHITLAFSDNGDGSPDGYEDGTGFLLIRALSSQLNAELTIESPIDGTGGMSVRVSLPVPAHRG